MTPTSRKVPAAQRPSLGKLARLVAAGLALSGAAISQARVSGNSGFSIRGLLANKPWPRFGHGLGYCLTRSGFWCCP